MSDRDHKMDFKMERSITANGQEKRKLSPSPEDARPHTRHAGSDPMESMMFAPANNSLSSKLVILERPSKARGDQKDEKENPEVKVKVEEIDGPTAGTTDNRNTQLFTIKKEPGNGNQPRVAGHSRPAPEDRTIKPPRVLIVAGPEPGIISWLDLSRCRVPSDKEIEKAFKSRRDLEDNLLRHSLFLDWIIEASPAITTLCEERFAVHWGTIRARCKSFLLIRVWRIIN